MNENYKEKLDLLSDLVSFAVIDGALHPKEYQFLQLIACELKVKTHDFEQLFHEDLKPRAILSELNRIEQFYRLALLMHCDGILHEKENNFIHEIGIKMALNPFAINRILKAMAQSETQTISADYLLEVFHEQLN